MKARIDRIADGVGIFLLVSAGVLISSTLVSADPVSPALCGVEWAPFSASLQLMPAYLAMLIVGAGNSARPYVKELLKRDFGKKDLKRIFLGFLVSGGSVYRRDGKYCLRYYGKDAPMHEAFRDLASQIYGAAPRTIRVESRGTYMSQLYSKAAVLEALEFSPEMAARKGRVPTISYILEGDRNVRVEAARAAMSNSGWVTCTFAVQGSAIKAYPRLGFGSVVQHHLAVEYLQLMETMPVHLDYYESRKYPGKGYLATTDCSEMESFLCSGGFLEGSTVKKGTFSGMEKNRLLMALVESKGEAFLSRENAVDHIMGSDPDSSLELSIYLDRIRLG